MDKQAFILMLIGLALVAFLTGTIASPLIPSAGHQDAAFASFPAK